jgi:hypothetical protein
VHIQPEVILVIVPKHYRRFPLKESCGTLDYLRDILSVQFPVDVALDRIVPLEVEEDLGPITKLTGLVTHFSRYSSITNWIICDDDVMYADDTILRYHYALETKAANPEVAQYIFTHFSEDYRIYTKFDGDDTNARGIHHIQGVDTFLIQRDILLNHPILQLENILNFVRFFHEVCPLSFYQDDYVISFIFAAGNIKVKSLWNNIKVAGHIEGVSLSNYQATNNAKVFVSYY